MSTEDTTQQERIRMLAGGMEEWPRRRLEESLDAIGYAIQRANSFNYINTGNAITYKARSIYIVVKGTGMSFANINANRDKLPELQEIRRSVFCFERGRIWEL